MKSLFFIFFTGSILLACNESKPEQDLTIVPLASATTDSSINISSNNNQNLPQQVSAASVNGMPQVQSNMPQNAIPQSTMAQNDVAQTVVQQSNAIAVTAAGINPEHGKSGHRCDIAVGAPLNSAPAKTTAKPTGAAQPTAVQPAVTAAKTVTAKGMNPPHGEPGHRCDISVGAPLNSAPTGTVKSAPVTTAATTITPSAAPAQNNALVPALQNSSINTTPKTSPAFTGKINPAHGQPGHDCKVAVGEPLP